MIIKPFCGFRPKKEYVKNVTTPPYDVVSRDDVRKALSMNELSFFKVTRADGLFDDSFNEYDSIIYKKARENWQWFLRKKIFILDNAPHFYVLSQKFNKKERIGLYAIVSMEDYESGRIKKHELTREEKLIDRTKHIEVVKAQTGPVMLFFKDDRNFKGLIGSVLMEKPVFEFSDENGVLNKLWAVNRKDLILNIEDFFKEIDFLYIADGHHRAEAAYNIFKNSKDKSFSNLNSWLLSVIFPHDQLLILSYNRIIKGVEHFLLDDFIDYISKIFYVKQVKDLIPNRKGDIRFYCDGKCFSIRLRSKKNDDIAKNLDVNILHEFILKPYFNIHNPSQSDRIEYIGGFDSVEQIKKKVDMGNAITGFSLYPVDIEDIINISNDNKIMPPKSTWFEPKLRDGIVVYSLENKNLLEKV